MSMTTNMVSRGVTVRNKGVSNKNSLVLSVRADDVVTYFIGFKEAIKKFTINAKNSKNSPSNSTKSVLKSDVQVIDYQTKNLEYALRKYSRLNPEYQKKLEEYIRKLYDFRVHMLSKIKNQLNTKTPKFSYRPTRQNTFNQNLRNNIVMRKTRHTNIKNSTTGEIYARIEYISIPGLDRVLEEILPPRAYSKLHPNSASAAANNVDGPANLFGSVEGGRRKTHKRRRHTSRN